MSCTCWAQSTDPLAVVRTLYSERQYPEAQAQAEALRASPDAKVARQAALWVAHCHRALGQYDEAIALYAQLAEATRDSVTVDALVGLADALQLTGRYSESEDVLRRALELYPEIADTRLQTSTVYNRNRAQYESAVDFARGQLRKLALRWEGADNDTGALLAWRQIYLTYPDHPDARNVALHLADLLRARGQAQAALPFYFAALETPADRCFSTEAVLAVNQAYLDAMAKPPAEEHLIQTLTGINACIAELFPGAELDESSLAELEKMWSAALADTYEPFSEHGRPQWCAASVGQPWDTLCQLAVARSLLRDGYYAEALTLLEALDTPLPSLRQRRLMLGAEAHLALRHFDQAIRQARAALHGSDRVLVGRAHLLMGRAAETALDFDAAAEAYRVAQSGSPAHWDRREAEFALGRVSELAALGETSTPVEVLPDDRTTRGDWPLGYGREHYILCAQNFILDRSGGPGPRLQVRAGTTDPGEPSRLWVSQREDDDPVALWDPFVRTHRPANRDDYGEQYPIGGGPDLVLALEVPEGAHVLSLYFANDYNYYEPNRAYTITVEDEGLAAVTEVRDFGGGVYKRFAVTGPASLRVHIWRNTSLNTLLSGVFLDPVPSPDLNPPVAPATACTTPTLLARCRPVAGVVAADPMAALAETDALIQALRTAPPHPDVSWALAELLHARGHHREAEGAFDAYQASLADDIAPAELPGVYDALGRALVARAQQSEDVNLQLEFRRRMKHGSHRWDRVCDAYLDALTSDDQEASVGALRSAIDGHDEYPCAFVAAKAFERLAQLSPETVDTPALLYRRAQILDKARMPAEALPLLERLLAGDLSTGLRTDVTWLLLRMQVSTGRDPDAVEATYTSLLDLRPTDDQQRNALYLLANTYLNAGDRAAARGRLEEYEQRYGPSGATQALLRRCGGEE